MPAGQHECHARKDGSKDRCKSRREKTEAMDLEANPEEIESELEHQKSLRKRLQWKLSEHRRTDMRTGIQL
jgi:hypothetical protein